MLQSQVAPTDPRYQQIENVLLGSVDLELINVPEFCDAAQPAATIPDVPDYTSGNWLPELISYAKAVSYYNLCQEAGAEALLQTSRLITTAELIAINTTPIVIIPAQGAGVQPIPLYATGKVIFNTTAFGGSPDLVFAYDNAGTLTPTIGFDSGLLAATADSLQVAVILQGSPIPPNENQDLVFAGISPGTAPTTGDGSLLLTLYYCL